MAVEIGALRAMLSLDSAAFGKGIKRAQAQMNGFQRNMDKASRKLRSVGRTMSTRVTAPLVAMGAVAVRSSLQTIDAQGKMAQSLGTTTESLQVLARAADTAGISQGDLEGALTRMTRRISLAEQGTGPAVDALERLKLTAADFENLDADDRIRLIQERIQDLIPAAEQAGLSSQIFGDRVGIAMTRLDASQIDEAERVLKRFGVTVSEVETDKIEKANDAISAIGLVTRGLANQLTVALAPTLEAIAVKIAEWGEKFNNLSPRMKTIIASVGALAAAIGPAVIVLGTFSAALAAVSLPMIAIAAVVGTVAAGIVLIGNKIKTATPHLDAAKETQIALNEALGTFSKTSSPEAAAGAINLANDLKKQAQATISAAKAQIALNEAAMSGMRPGAQSGLVQRQIDAANARIAKAQELIAEAEAAQNTVAGEVTSGRTTLPAITIESDNKELENAKNTITDLTSGLSGASSAAGGLSGKLQDVSDVGQSLSPLQEKMQSVGKTIENSMGSAFMSMVEGTKSAKDAFRDMARSIISQLFEMFVVKQITGFIGNAIGGFFNANQVSGPAMPLGTGNVRPVARPSFAGGGYTGNGARVGGLDGKGGFMAMMHPRETVVDHTKGQSAGGVVVNQTINVSTGVQQTVRTEIKSLMPQIAESAKSAVVDAKRRGGSYGRAFA